MPMERITSENLRKAMQANISASAHIMTDELPAYRFVPGSFVDHQTVDHGRDEYVRGNAHVNTAEGFFSLLKRAVNAILKTSVGDSPERSPIPNESTITESSMLYNFVSRALQRFPHRHTSKRTGHTV